MFNVRSDGSISGCRRSIHPSLNKGAVGPKEKPAKPSERRTHLADVEDLHLALRVPGGDLLASVGPSDTVQRCRSVHKHTGSGNLRHTTEQEN